MVLILSEHARAARVAARAAGSGPGATAVTAEEQALAELSAFRSRLEAAYIRCGLPVVDADGTPDEVVSRVAQVSDKLPSIVMPPSGMVF